MLGRILIAAVKSYQLLISSWTLPSCRFTPTCSSYAVKAIERHGAFRGSWLAMKRIARCHPWGGFGYDPVPDGEGGRAQGHRCAEHADAESAPRLGGVGP
ncbi:MAG: membrane protein insertion efficiency factor YidD [Gemmatimonadota bacterium]